MKPRELDLSYKYKSKKDIFSGSWCKNLLQSVEGGKHLQAFYQHEYLLLPCHITKSDIN